MKSTWLRATVPLFLILAGVGAGTWSFGRTLVVAEPTAWVLPASYVLPTTYVAPTSYVTTSYVAPTTYVAPTSYFVPTSYSIPAVYATSLEVPTYAATSYVVPTYYTYRRRGLFGFRRNAAVPVYTTARTYVPTTYYAAGSSLYPTLYDYPVATALTATTLPACCTSATPTATAQASSTRAVAPEVEEQRPSSVVDSIPAPSAPAREAGRAPSSVNNEPALEERPAPAPAPEETRELAPAPAPLSKPTTALPRNDRMPDEVAPLPQPAPSNPAEPLSLPPVEPERRTAQRPVLNTPVSPTVRNVLAGKVVSGDTKDPEEGVKLILSSKSHAFTDRQATTDAFGRYAVRLPDGDWTVKVVMPSGNVYAVRDLTISGGTITDDLGRNIPSLVITR